ncbi:hypothetical protein Salat_0120900 [Sesamum alatum]|uniref:DUF4283 domain-containing protein n=1 Tax=Sesamum alatum TaxID=300844 RepID=A0AAE2CXN3_9LAMI|nr:hypothetical protein Salat_0120900 [Sesamum alatum]
MESELGRLGAALSNTEDEESGLVFPTGLWHAEPLTSDFFVVGRLLSTKSFHPEALHSTLKLAFNPVRGMEFKLIEGECFLLKFFHTVDRARVLDRCPWAYDKNLLVLAPMEASDDPNVVDLDWCDFHVHIHGLPLGKMTKEIAAFIGNRMGRYKDVDLDSKGDLWGSSVRIRAAIKVTQPLQRALKVHTVLGHEHLISFTFGWFPGPGDNLPYGHWLRAAAHLNYRGRNRGTWPVILKLVPVVPVLCPKAPFNPNPPPQPTPRRGSAIFGAFDSFFSPTKSASTPLPNTSSASAPPTPISPLSQPQAYPTDWIPTSTFPNLLPTTHKPCPPPKRPTPAPANPPKLSNLGPE